MTREELRAELRAMADEILHPKRRLRGEAETAYREKIAKHFDRKAQAKIARHPRHRRESSLEEQGVYVIGAAGNPIKIGVAKDAGKRLRSIQTGSAVSLRIYAHVPVAPGQAYNVEHACHSRLADYRLKGEWFDYDPYEALALVRAVIEELGVSPTS